MAIWDKVRQGIDKAGKAAQDVFDEGKLHLGAYRARQPADKAAEALGYAIFRAADAGGELEAEARLRLLDALRARDAEARKLETDLENERAAAGAAEVGRRYGEPICRPRSLPVLARSRSHQRPSRFDAAPVSRSPIPTIESRATSRTSTRTSRPYSPAGRPAAR
jgi:hypothetical protein